LLWTIVGVAAILVGIAQMTGGLGGIFGGTSRKISALLGESDSAIEKARDFAGAADGAIGKLLETLNASDLATVRAAMQTDVESARKDCADAAGQFRMAATKIGDAQALGVEGELAEYLKLRAEAYESFAKAYDAKGSVAAAVLDESLVDQGELLAKVNAAAETANAAFASAELSVKRSDDIAKELQAK
jgi:hypothetical protein